MTCAKHLATVVALFALTLQITDAFGEETKAAEKQALKQFKRGRALLKKGRFAKACAAFDKSVALNPSVGAYLNLGECNQELDRIASAKRAFDEATALAFTQGDKTRAKYATERAQTLAPRLSYVVISLARTSEADSDVVVSLDGDTVPQGELGKRIPADIGAHKVNAVRGDGVQFNETVTLAREATEIEVEVSFRDDDGPARKILMKNNGHGNKVDPAGVGPVGVEEPSSGRSRTLPLALLAGAAAAAGTGSYFGLSARNRWDQASACRETRCSSSDSRLADSARTRGHVATALFGVAAISAGIGVWLLLRGDDAPEERSITVGVGPTSASLRVSF